MLQKNWFDLFIITIAIFSVISFSLETLPDLTSHQTHLLAMFEIFSVSVFSIEYVFRIYKAEKKISYIFSFYGIVDLLSILPFYLTFFVDFSALKIFRLFRLVRILKIARYSKALHRFGIALRETKEEFVLFFTLIMLLFYLSSVGIYYFEHMAQPDKFASVFDSMWWAVATLTTVGYGDTYPVTIGGKVFTAVILLIGLSVISIPAGIISSALTEIKGREK